MSEEEFWQSTPRKVLKLRDIVMEKDKRRDYFVAFLTSAVLNFMGSKESKTVTPDDLLACQYPQKSVIVTPKIDPDLGAQGDWKSLREGLRGYSG